MDNRLRATLYCAGLLLASGCESPPPPTSGYTARQIAEVQRWEILDAGERVGWLMLMQIDDPAGPLRFYRVENQRGQWLGFATLEGRFSRRVPFRDDDEDLGLYGMHQGIARLMDLRAQPTIATWQPDGVRDASARKDDFQQKVPQKDKR